MANFQFRILFVSLLIVVVFNSIHGQITNTFGRKCFSLDGTWQIAIDPYDRYIDERGKGISANIIAKNKSERLEYGFSHANVLNVPGDWNTQNEKLFYYEGSIWYKRDFLFEKKNTSNYIIHFGAVNYSAEVFLNGSLLGIHEGGFTSFQFDCSRHLCEGKNVVTVRVNNERKIDRVPSLDFDWWNYGGITRSVNIIELPATFISDFSIELNNKNTNTISGWIKLGGGEYDGVVELIIDELKIHKKLNANNNSQYSFSIRTTPQLWTPEHPKLYDVKIIAGKDTVIDRIGFRRIETKGTKIYLNGEPVFLAGICLHEEALFTGGRITNVEQLRTLFNYAKELNCNFVRLAHYPYSEEALRLADEMGFMVWSEVPVWQNIDFKSEQSSKIAKQMLSDMIIRDKNRASIILWSVSNETDNEKEGRLDFLKSMINLARSLDSTRLITSALHRQQVNPTTMRFEDPLGEYLDVLAANEYIGWYQGKVEDFKTMKWETIFDKPHIISEFGAEAVFGYHADSQTIWSEEFQETIYKGQIEMFGRIPFLAGTSPWILKDFRSPRRLNPEFQNNWNNKGLISNQGERKKAFFLMQKYYESLN